MFRKAISRVRVLSTLDISAAESLTRQWEPTLLCLPSRPHAPQPIENEDQNGPWFTTYSAFDPGCARPFLISGLSIGIKDLKTTVLIPSTNTKAVIKPDTQALVKSSNEGKMVAEMMKVYKPWPYRLPKALQPQEGTTFAAMYGGGLESFTTSPSSSPSSEAVVKKVGILQALLYGLPDPDNSAVKEKGQEDGFLHKVLYGVKDEEEK